MKPFSRFSLTLLGVVTLHAGPLLSGQHPNLDSQFTQTSTFELTAQLARQFPQYNFVWQDPLVGFFSPVDPGQLVIWTSLIPPGSGPDPFASGLDEAPCANGRCVLALQAPPPGSGGGPGAVIAPGGGGGPNDGGPGAVIPPDGGGDPNGGGPTGGGPADPGGAPLPSSIPEPKSVGMLLTGLSIVAIRAALRKNKR